VRWETERSFDGILRQEYSYQKLSKYVNCFSRYSQKCRGCFFSETQCTFLRPGDVKLSDSDAMVLLQSRSGCSQGVSSASCIAFGLLTNVNRGSSWFSTGLRCSLLFFTSLHFTALVRANHRMLYRMFNVARVSSVDTDAEVKVTKAH